LSCWPSRLKLCVPSCNRLSWKSSCWVSHAQPQHNLGRNRPAEAYRQVTEQMSRYGFTSGSCIPQSIMFTCPFIFRACFVGHENDGKSDGARAHSTATHRAYRRPSNSNFRHEFPAATHGICFEQLNRGWRPAGGRGVRDIESGSVVRDSAHAFVVQMTERNQRHVKPSR